MTPTQTVPHYYNPPQDEMVVLVSRFIPCSVVTYESSLKVENGDLLLRKNQQVILSMF